MRLIGEQHEVFQVLKEMMEGALPGSEVQEIKTLPDGTVEVELEIPIPPMNAILITIPLDPDPTPRDDTEENTWRRHDPR